MTDVRQLSSAPSMTALYPKALAASVRPALKGLARRGGSGSPALPDLELTLAELELDRAHLTDYDRVCGFALRDDLPATYLHVLAFPLAMEIMTDSRFPFPVIGLVQIANRIEQLRPLTADERPTMRVRPERLAVHERGTQFEIVAEAAVDGKPVWRSRSSYLRRGGGGGRGQDRRGRGQVPEREPSAVWKVRGDIGRRYAAVSGDSNPIHIHPLTARLFGLPRPIAHGMWLKARCLAALESALPRSYDVEVRFKLPVPLPARVGFAAWGDGRGYAFSLTDMHRHRPHLTGAVAPR